MATESGSSPIEWKAASSTNRLDQPEKPNTPAYECKADSATMKADVVATSSIPELVRALKKDQELLVESYNMLSNEKKMRDEKEMALTERIDLLNMKISDKEEELSRTVGARTTLEIQVETMKNEISVLMIKLDTVQRSYTEEVTTLEKNVRELRREQEKRLSDVSYKHFKDCDEMRRKLFHSQLEGDQYKLGKKGQVNEDKASMGKSPLADQNGVNHPKEPTTVKKEYRASSDEPQKPEKRKQFRIFRFLFKLCVYILFLCMLILSAGSGYYIHETLAPYQKTGLTEGIFCSPVMPTHTKFGKQPFTYEAPYMIPQKYKEFAFKLVCKDKKRTRVIWYGEEFGKFVIEDVRRKKGEKSILWADGVKSGTFYVDNLRIISKIENKVHVAVLPWL